jgi:hypothetical protein
VLSAVESLVQQEKLFLFKKVANQRHVVFDDCVVERQKLIHVSEHQVCSRLAQGVHNLGVPHKAGSVQAGHLFVVLALNKVPSLACALRMCQQQLDNLEVRI